MANRDRFKSSIGFTDLLFNLLVGFVFLFVIAFILINPPVKKSDAPKKAEYLIVIEWDHDSADDIDLWVRDPLGVTVSYTNREGGLLNLEKDDLGAVNDRWRNADGEIVTIRLNREVITMRGITEGRFQVAAHVYSKKEDRIKGDDGQYYRRPNQREGTITGTLIRINPYGELYKVERKYQWRSQVFALFNFTLDENGDLIDLDEDANKIVYRGGQHLEGN